MSWFLKYILNVCYIFIYFFCLGWYEKYLEVEFFNLSEILNDFVVCEKLGKKIGEGFYKYE